MPRSAYSPSAMADGTPSIIKAVECSVYGRSGAVGGGNPLTVFCRPPSGGPAFASVSVPYSSPSSVMTSDVADLRDHPTRSILAQSCNWESAFVVPGAEVTDAPRFHFHLPTGEEVDMCGHAAMGAAAIYDAVFSAAGAVLYDSPAHLSFLAGSGTTGGAPTEYRTAVTRTRRNGGAETTERHVRMEMACRPRDLEAGVDRAAADGLLAQLGLAPSDVSASDPRRPSYVRASAVGRGVRSKLLVPLASPDALQHGCASSPADPVRFRELCDEVGCTGVYLYVPAGDDFECRQFPRASAYPEDPATGVAAAALAASLWKRTDKRTFVMHQGTAMGRPSTIKVQILDGAPVEGSPNPSDTMKASTDHCRKDDVVDIATLLISGIVSIAGERDVYLQPDEGG